MDYQPFVAYPGHVFRVWWIGEAGWRQNRLHLLLAAISVVLAFATMSVGAVVTATVIVGALLGRIMLWDRARTATPILLRRSGRR